METITNEPSEVDAVIIDTPEPEKTAYEQADEALTIIDQAMKPIKIKQAEDTQPMIEIKTVDDEPEVNLARTPQQRKNMREGQVGDIRTAEKIEQRSDQIVAKWRQLKSEGPLQEFQLYKNGKRRETDLLLDEINTVDPSLKPIPTNRVGGRKKKNT